MESHNKWYFAYGSNMLSEVFVARRKVQPLKSEGALIKTYALCFNVMGIPYTDPGMGGIRLLQEGDSDLPVHGVAYLLTPEDMRRVVISEGGGIAYRTVCLEATLQTDGSTVTVTTLIGRHDIPRDYERPPSRRYLDLLIRGAAEHCLPESYQTRLLLQSTYQPLSSLRYRAGKWLFDSVWLRVAIWIERGVHTFKDEEGNVPGWFLFCFDCLLWTMWMYHDYVHSILWGRGDRTD